MLKNKYNTTITHGITESRQKIMKITGIVMSCIPVIPLRLKGCPKSFAVEEVVLVSFYMSVLNSFDQNSFLINCPLMSLLRITIVCTA